VANAKSIDFDCIGTESDAKDSCYWEISQVSCVKPGDVIKVVNLGAGVPRTPVACGKKQASIWTPPKAPAKRDNCRVTVGWVGSADCEAVASSKYAGQSPRDTSALKEPKLITFVDLKELFFECKGTQSTGCSYSILSTECK
jgi:hypothetical protein